MADKLIKNLTRLTSPDAGDVLPIYDITADDTKKIQVDEIGTSFHVYTGVLNSATNLISTSTDGSADTLIFNDANDSNKAKKTTISGFIDDIYWRILNKISLLGVAGTLTGSDELVISQSNLAKKVTFTTLSNDISSGVFDKIDDIATELTAPAKDDYVVVSDTTDSGAGKKMKFSNLFGGWGNITTLTNTAYINVYGNNTTDDVNKITFQNLVNSVFARMPNSGSTTVATNDYIGYKTAAGSGKAITFANFVKSIFGNITNQTSKATPVGADEIIIADSASSGVAKKTTLTQLAATSLFTSASLNAIHSQTEKATVVDADEFVINDSAASWGVKKATFSTLLTWILSKYQNIFNKGNDLPVYPSMSIDYDYLIGVESDTGTAVKIFPKDVIRSIVSSTTVDITISGAFGGYNPGLLLVDANSGNRTISLPAATTHKYIQWSVKKIDGSANTVTIDPNASETIDGAAAYVLSSQYSTVTFISDGSAWYII